MPSSGTWYLWESGSCWVSSSYKGDIHMRLWHESLIPHLPRQQLLGQHRECCALRGLGWGKPHATVNYVFQHPPEWLWVYHMRVMREMLIRGYHPGEEWMNPHYRGKYCIPYGEFTKQRDIILKLSSTFYVYPEHDDEYLQECLDNLMRKGIEVSL